MNPRLIILLVLAAGLAIYFATRAAAPPSSETIDEGPTFLPGHDQLTIEDIRDRQRNVDEFPIRCEEPPEPPEFGVQVERRPGDKKNRLYYTVNEAHGYYVAYLVLMFYYKPEPSATFEETPLQVEVRVNNYIRANETFSSCFEIVAAELSSLPNEDMGTSENWAGFVVDYGRACLENPDEFPPVTDMTMCDQ